MTDSLSANGFLRSLRRERAAGRPGTQPRRLQIDPAICCSCGACVAVCPPDALFLRGLTLTVDHDTCTACDRCVPTCPVRALTLVTPEIES